jgi:hypothetical protein
MGGTLFVHHPLSGGADAPEFHLDAGRLCFMLPRHCVTSWIFARGVWPTLKKQLRNSGATGRRQKRNRCAFIFGRSTVLPQSLMDRRKAAAQNSATYM